jgi:predicted AAA+ superfamily ATPase
MIGRTQRENIEKKLFKGKAIVLTGARQTGKTTLIKSMLDDQKKVIHLNCDEPVVRETLTDANLSDLKRVVGKNKIVFIDEAQRIENIGLTLKIIIDNIDDVQLIVTGSSSLDLANEINEPLTGRKWEYQLYPISWSEFVEFRGYIGAKSELEQRILYGMYPDVISNSGEEYDVLIELSDSYLYKDLLAFNGIRKPDLLEKLLQALALQVGSEVSIHELSKQLHVSSETVDTYIDLLEKSFVLFRLPAYSTNPRKEISKMNKIFFWDNGVRNAVIGNYDDVSIRQDVGQLWENFMISERLKMNSWLAQDRKEHFWRNYNQSEVDYVELDGNQLSAFEMKWRTNKKIKVSVAFTNTYPNAQTSVVTPTSFAAYCGLIGEIIIGFRV